MSSKSYPREANASEVAAFRATGTEVYRIEFSESPGPFVNDAPLNVYELDGAYLLPLAAHNGEDVLYGSFEQLVAEHDLFAVDETWVGVRSTLHTVEELAGALRNTTHKALELTVNGHSVGLPAG